MRLLIIFFGLAMLALPATNAAAQAVDSCRSGVNWGTCGAAGGASSAIMHNQLGTVAQRVQQAERGEPFSTNTNNIYAIGTQNVVNVNGDNNTVDGNELTGTNSGDVDNTGCIGWGSTSQACTNK
jgi:hypothetical protein